MHAGDTGCVKRRGERRERERERARERARERERKQKKPTERIVPGKEKRSGRVRKKKN